MNQLSIQLSNEAMARGLALARERGASSLEQLIELLLLLDEGSVEGVSSASDGPQTTAGNALAPEMSCASTDFDVNPGALTLERPTSLPALPLADHREGESLPLPSTSPRLVH